MKTTVLMMFAAALLTSTAACGSGISAAQSRPQLAAQSAWRAGVGLRRCTTDDLFEAVFDQQSATMAEWLSTRCVSETDPAVLETLFIGVGDDAPLE